MEEIINIDDLCDEFTKKNIITKKEDDNENLYPDKVIVIVKLETIEVKENIKKVIKIKKVVDKIKVVNTVVDKVVDKVVNKVVNTVVNTVVDTVVDKVVDTVVDTVVIPERKEVQAHGFTWEEDLLLNVYKATSNELKDIKYNSKMDLPAKLNRLDVCDISVKTSCSPNAVYMSDCLRMFDAVSSNKPLHMVVVHYTQDDINNGLILK